MPSKLLNNHNALYQTILIHHYETECVQNFVDHVRPYEKSYEESEDGDMPEPE